MCGSFATAFADASKAARMHYPSDSMAGAVLGIGIGKMLVNWLTGQPSKSWCRG